MAIQTISAELLRSTATEKPAPKVDGPTTRGVDSDDSFNKYLKSARRQRRDEDKAAVAADSAESSRVDSNNRESSEPVRQPEATDEQSSVADQRDSSANKVNSEEKPADQKSESAGESEAKAEQNHGGLDGQESQNSQTESALSSDASVVVDAPILSQSVVAHATDSQVGVNAAADASTANLSTINSNQPLVSEQSGQTQFVTTQSQLNSTVNQQAQATAASVDASANSTDAATAVNNQTIANNQTENQEAGSQSTQLKNQTLAQSSESAKQVSAQSSQADQVESKPQVFAAGDKNVVKPSSGQEKIEQLKSTTPTAPVQLRESTQSNSNSNSSSNQQQGHSNSSSGFQGSLTADRDATAAAGIRTGIGDGDAASLARFLIQGQPDASNSAQQAATRLSGEGVQLIDGTAGVQSQGGFGAKAVSPQQALTNILMSGVEKTLPLDKAVQVMHASNRPGRMQVSLQLSPPELGQLRLQVDMQKEAMHLRVDVDSRSVGKLVESNISELRDALAAHGIRIERTDVVVRSNESADVGDQRAQEDFSQAGASDRDGDSHAEQAGDEGLAGGDARSAEDDSDAQNLQAEIDGSQSGSEPNGKTASEMALDLVA